MEQNLKIQFFSISGPNILKKGLQTSRGGGANAGHFSAFLLSFLKKCLFTYINA